ncbi:hybrid sensor histidine kinase/response regulator transcription factor [Chryseosolibacter indicus]|uniref:histidine kinase n=1 Tax=Chryseosolibacter indicus TaxID=2782351 RepID=A0ABS5VQM9_9BACT|nr:hybrid sensor histidine kinase/response regulator transcription factor [Chryseosolibacter indicus]MBT1702316.1 response regulator [Chryseosolibacter indicus]
MLTTNKIGFYIIALVIFLSGQIHTINAQTLTPKLKHLTVEDGLSHNWVRSIIKDSRGFMWFGTFNGLNRFDGQSFKVYKVNSGNNLSDNFIESLAEDQLGNIWVGTFSGGLNLFNRETEQFTNFIHNSSDPNSISGNKIYSIYPDRDKNLWIGTDGGLDRFDYKTKTFKHYKNKPGNPHSIAEGAITALYKDHEGNLWIGTDKGLNILDNKENRFRHFVKRERNNNGLTHNYVKSIFEDKYGNIWIGTWGGGLNRFDKDTETFEHFTTQNSELNNDGILWLTGDNEGHVYIGTEGGGLNIFNIETKTLTALNSDIEHEEGLKSNSIHTLYYDTNSGILWLGSYNGGISYFSKWDKPFIHHKARKHGLSDNHITCITEDKNENLWIGTDGGGVNFINRHTGVYKYYQHQKNDNNSILNNAVLSMLCDSKNNIWIGTFNGGLDKLDVKINKIQHFLYDPESSSGLAGRHVSAIYEDKRGNLWVGTMTGGLHLFNNKNNTFTRFQHDPTNPKSIIDDFIIGISEDSQGGLLVQTGKGLDAFDYRTKTFERFGTSYGVNFDVPSVVLEDSQNNLWIGSQELGLFKITRPSNKLSVYTIKDGLPSNNISGLLEDNAGNLWISTFKGLCKFENAITSTSAEAKFQIYSVEDGLQGTEFKPGAFCKRRNGNMVFGGQNGFNEFNPSSIKANPFIPPVKITGFKIFNKDVVYGKSEVLKTPVSELKKITLTADESVFTFEFSALNYIHAEKNQYAYKLENFDKDWNYVGSQSSATYTNLDAGDYIFKVKASNNDGVWNENGVTLAVTVLPPWWNLLWFKFLITCFIIGTAITYYKLRTYQLKQNKKELEHQVQVRTSALQQANKVIEERHEEIRAQNESLIQKNLELEKQATEIKRLAEEIKELNEAKLKFFTNISHELRTPLNLIIWPLEDMLQKKVAQEQLEEKYNLMHKNATRLIKLINQLLDFRKIETGSLELKLTYKNIVQSIHEIFNSFQDWAYRSRIHYSLETNVSQLFMHYDEDTLEKIITNLLSNAFKHVKEDGAIKVSIELKITDEKGKGRLLIAVRDNGEGIPEAQMPYIFNRFYEGTPAKIPGSGIGLALVKELVELHQGEISVLSEVGKGSTFEIKLPVDLQAEINNVLPQRITLAEQNFEDNEPEQLYVTSQGTIDTLPIILVVDDNEDIRNYISRKLGSLYHVEVSADGKEGIEKALDIIPDIIISDIMMPEKDGFELCQRLKSDERTSHVPIILLTARSGDEAQLKGLTIGADDYLTKPFKLDILQLKIKNILFTRQKLKQQFTKNPHYIPDNTQVSSADEAFLKKAVAVIEENLDNSDFDVERFSEYFNMSRRNVLRKLKGITGLSINEFIKNIRLKEAYKLLLQGDLNVAEVAYSVGFNDQKYFSKCFKEHFGKLPSELNQRLA